jgi:excisionase family DNA binding protein
MAQWLTFEEVAAYLKMGKSTIYTLARTGHLPAHPPSGSPRRESVAFRRRRTGLLAQSGRPGTGSAQKPFGPFRDRVYPLDKASGTGDEACDEPEDA